MRPSSHGRSASHGYVVPRITRRRKGGGEVYATDSRMVPEETPVAFSYNGTTHAVMMATPADMEDFAVGFSLSEGIISQLDEISEIAVEEHDEGVDVQIRLARRSGSGTHRSPPPHGRTCWLRPLRHRVDRAGAETGRFSRQSQTQTDAGRNRRRGQAAVAVQPLHSETGAVHAAGFYVPGKGIVAAREDVGRHNALDKLAGALCRAGVKGETGAVVITSRVSIEMVQKTAIIGAPILIAVSAPTALAIRTAHAAGMTLVALVRGDEFDVFTRHERIPVVMAQAGTKPDELVAGNATVKPNPDPAASTLVQSPPYDWCNMDSKSHKTTADKLVYMANQIATFFHTQPKDEAVAGVADHINHFWEPRMRDQLFDDPRTGGQWS